MQARFACEKIFSRDALDDKPLFSDEERAEMKEQIKEAASLNRKYNRDYKFIPDMQAYMLKLTAEIGCSPPDYKAMLTAGNTKEEVELGVALYYGPIISSQFRLTGPKPWVGAKQHIIATAKQHLGDYYEHLLKQFL